MMIELLLLLRGKLIGMVLLGVLAVFSLASMVAALRGARKEKDSDAS